MSATPATASVPPAMPASKRNSSKNIPKAPTSDPTQPPAAAAAPPEVLVVPDANTLRTGVLGMAVDKATTRMAEEIVDNNNAVRTPLINPRTGESIFGDVISKRSAAAPPPPPASAPSRGRRPAEPEPAPAADEPDKEAQSNMRIYTTYHKTFFGNPNLQGFAWVDPSMYARLPKNLQREKLDALRTAVNTSGKVGDMRSSFADAICGIAEAMNIMVAKGVLSPRWMFEDIQQLRYDITNDPDPNFETELQQLYCEWIEWFDLGPASRLVMRSFKILGGGTGAQQERRAAQLRAARNTKPPSGPVYDEV